jgi:hypothetical protein
VYILKGTSRVSVCAKKVQEGCYGGLVALQFLEVAVGDVIAAPVWNCVELDAVREFHFFLFGKPLELAEPLVTSPGLSVWGAVVGRLIPSGFREVVKFESGFGVVRMTKA